MNIFVVLLLLCSLALSQEFAIGGSTCDFAIGGGCSVQPNSAIVDFTVGVNVDSDNECVDGSGPARGVSYSFEVESDGIWEFSVRGLGGNAVLLVFSGDVDAEDGCSAWLTVHSVWSGLTEAGTYTAVVTANNGEADECLSFTAVGAPVPYEFTRSTDMQIQVSSYDGYCELSTLSTAWVGSFEFTPTTPGVTHYNIEGRFIPLVPAVEYQYLRLIIFPTDDLPEDMNDTATMCDSYANYEIQFDGSGFPMEVNTPYTFFIHGRSDISLSIEGVFYVNVIQTLPEIEEEEEECDVVLSEPRTFIRPNVPAIATTDVCDIESSSSYPFDVRHVSYEEDVFFVVDTGTCGGFNFDQVVVLYYGEWGSEATDSEDAVPPTTCDGFVIIGDSGDGGAVSYWFPAGEIITVVPTTWSFSASGILTYSLIMDAYEIVGCIPENPFVIDTTVATESSDIVDTVDTESLLSDDTEISDIDTADIERSDIESLLSDDTESSALSIIASFAVLFPALF